MRSDESSAGERLEMFDTNGRHPRATGEVSLTLPDKMNKLKGKRLNKADSLRPAPQDSCQVCSGTGSMIAKVGVAGPGPEFPGNLVSRKFVSKKLRADVKTTAAASRKRGRPVETRCFSRSCFRDITPVFLPLSGSLVYHVCIPAQEMQQSDLAIDCRQQGVGFSDFLGDRTESIHRTELRVRELE